MGPTMPHSACLTVLVGSFKEVKHQIITDRSSTDPRLQRLEHGPMAEWLKSSQIMQEDETVVMQRAVISRAQLDYNK